jgi:integrase
VLEVVRIILRKACNEWEWVDRVPMVRMLPEPTKRVCWLTRNEADRLIAELPPHLADMVRFSLETGLRRSNVTGLQWSQVDLVRRTAWIHPRPSEGEKGDSRSTVERSNCSIAQTDRQASGQCVQLQG